MDEKLKERLIEYRQLNKNSSRAIIKDKELKSDVIKFFENSEFSNLKLSEQAAIIIFGYKPKCSCGNSVKFESKRLSNFHSTLFGSWKQFCSTKCSTNFPEIREKIKQTNLNKFGFENPAKNEEIKKAIKQTNLEKYGFEFAFQNEEIKSKIRQSNLEKYGFEYPTQREEVREKVRKTNLKKFSFENVFQNEEIKKAIKQTNLEKYGFECSLKNEEVREKSRQTNLEKYGFDNPAKNEVVKLKIRQTNLERYGSTNSSRMGIFDKNPEFCSILDDSDFDQIRSYITSIAENSNLIYRRDIANVIGCSTTIINKLLNRIGLADKYTNHTISYSENELFEFIFELIPETTSVIQSNRSVLNGKELDIYIPDHNLAIEFNGIYWHSESNGKDSGYHLDKTKSCEAKGIQLLHIFENEWNDLVKKEIWKSIIKSKLGLISERIPARKCEFKIISPKQSREFLEVNHLNGFCGAEVHYGLIYNNQIVSVLSIGKSRFNKGEFEIIRFASKINTLVQGGFSKLLKHIDSKYKFNLVTFADRRYSNGSTYRKYFKFETETSPNWYGFNRRNSWKELKHRFSFQKHKLKELFGSTFDENLTAYENMLNHDFDRIWDAGNFKFNTLI